jgi:hypothetical protein
MTVTGIGEQKSHVRLSEYFRAASHAKEAGYRPDTDGITAFGQLMDIG